jgi:DHA2 family multidrug resistance protein
LALQYLQAVGKRANTLPASRYQAMDLIVSAQAQTLAINEIFWLYGFVFLGVLALVWLARPPFGAPPGAPAH